MPNVHDRIIQYKRGRLFLPTHRLVGGANEPDYKESEVGSNLGYNAAVWSSTGYTVGSPLVGKFIVPTDWNPNFPLGVSVYWVTDSATTSDTVDWKIFLHMIKVGEVIPFGNTSVLDTVIAQDTNLGAKFLHRTSRGIRNKNWSTIKDIHNGLMGQMNVELDATTVDVAGTENVWLLGVLFDYVPMLTRQPHSEHDAPLTNDLQ